MIIGLNGGEGGDLLGGYKIELQIEFVSTSLKVTEGLCPTMC